MDGKQARCGETVGRVAALWGLALVMGACGGEAAHGAATSDGSASEATTTGVMPGPESTTGEPGVVTTGGDTVASGGAAVVGTTASGGGAGTTVSGGGGAASTDAASVDGTIGSTGSFCTVNCECTGESSPVALDEYVISGATPSDILAFSAGTHRATLVYGTDLGVGSVSFDRESTTIELEIEPLGTARYIWSAHIPESSPYCTSALAIDVNVKLKSEDGAFDEEFTTILTTTSADFARLSIPLTFAELTGSYAPRAESRAPDSVELTGAGELAVQFGPGVFAGDMLADYTWCYQSHCMSSFTSISRWGYCPFGGFELDTSEDPRVALSDVLDTWESIPEMEAVWADGTTSPLTAELSFDETGLCRESNGYRVHAQLALNTEDGRLAIKLGVDVEYFFDSYSRSLYITGPTGESDAAVDRFQLGYSSELDAPIITLSGSVVLQTSEEISFR